MHMENVPQVDDSEDVTMTRSSLGAVIIGRC